MNYYLCTVSTYAGTHNDVTREVIVSREHLDRETIKKMLKVSDERKLISIEIPRAIKVNVVDNIDLKDKLNKSLDEAISSNLYSINVMHNDNPLDSSYFEGLGEGLRGAKNIVNCAFDDKNKK